ncbi:hypothetical protein DIPPA_22541 [Diplonema papillatum]|nr:hypothetical protein DIPPA_22541 [Diplonema papillatum]
MTKKDTAVELSEAYARVFDTLAKNPRQKNTCHKCGGETGLDGLQAEWTGRVDVLEADLRAKDGELLALREQVAAAGTQLAGLKEELQRRDVHGAALESRAMALGLQASELQAELAYTRRLLEEATVEAAARGALSVSPGSPGGVLQPAGDTSLASCLQQLDAFETAEAEHIAEPASDLAAHYTVPSLRSTQMLQSLADPHYDLSSSPVAID